MTKREITVITIYPSKSSYKAHQEVVEVADGDKFNMLVRNAEFKSKP